MCVGLAQSGTLSSYWNVTCFRHDMAEKLLFWSWTTITHSLFALLNLNRIQITNCFCVWPFVLYLLANILFVLYLLANILFVLLWFVVSDYPFSRYLQTFLIVPNVEMNITWIIFIDYLQGVDENYDGILSEFFTPYHALVDLVCRVAVNQQILNEHIINLSEYQKAIFICDGEEESFWFWCLHQFISI
jgi:hypothetical protein